MADRIASAGRGARRDPHGTARRWLLAGLLALCSLALLAPSAAAKTPPDRELVDVYAAVEGAHLGEVLPGGPEHFIEVVDSPKYSLKVHEYGQTYTAGAVTELAYNPAKTEAIGAKITIYGISHSSGGSLIRGVIAHEVFHVFEARMSGNEATDRAHAGWLEEGAATWVESDLVSNDPTAREDWKEYLKSPTTELFKRLYDAVGFFGHMASSGISPWSRFKAMFKATSSEQAWNEAVGGQTGYLDSEASSFFRESPLGSEWEQTGPNVPSSKEARAKPISETVHASSTPLTLTAKPHADAIYSVSIKTPAPGKTSPLTEPAVEVVLKSGNARIAATEGGHLNEAITGQILLCSDPKGCSTPDCPKHYAPFERGNIAVTGGASGGSVTLTRRKPCESLQPEVSCEKLLPGFVTEIARGIGQTVGNPGGLLQSISKPSGSYVSECLFLTKDASVDAEGNFRGAIGFAMVLRSPSLVGAQMFFSILQRTPGLAPIAGYGEEALLKLMTTTGPEGAEYDSEAAVRVGNEVAFFGVYSTPGNEEADRPHTLALLRTVAGEI